MNRRFWTAPVLWRSLGLLSATSARGLAQSKRLMAQSNFLFAVLADSGEVPCDTPPGPWSRCTIQEPAQNQSWASNPTLRTSSSRSNANEKWPSSG